MVGAGGFYSKVLDCELWIVADDETETELRHEGVVLPILLPEEADRLGRMAEEDARELFRVFAMVQAAMPGARLRDPPVSEPKPTTRAPRRVPTPLEVTTPDPARSLKIFQAA